MLLPSQVHRAVWKGKEVAVKVQRTGLDALFKNDLQNLKFAAKVPQGRPVRQRPDLHF